MTGPDARFGPASPFLVVSDLSRSLVFYQDRLRFECRFSSPADTPFFAVLGRGAAQLMLKEIGEDVQPRPNAALHPWARWDVFIHAEDVVAEARSLGKEPAQTDGLFGFEVTDPDGYVLFIGRPSDGDEDD